MNNRGDPEQRAAFRAFVKSHHPDRGGDPDVFAAGLTAFRSAPPAESDPRPADRFDAPVVVESRRRALARRARRWCGRRRPRVI